MNYVVLDLEWNQPISFQSQVYREVGNKLLFDMIQIGAARVNESFQVLDTISIPIRPQKYMKIHPRIRRMTGLGAEELADAPVFQEAMDQFIAWCGEDCVFLTWGCDDISVLYQNMHFYGWEKELPPMYDIQRLFSDACQCKDRKGLKLAMEMLELQPEEGREFHNAEHDAYYTAQVFVRLPEPGLVLNYPEQPKSLIHQHRTEGENVKGKNYSTVQEALASQEATQPACPVCGKPTKLEEEGYVPQTGDKYIGLSRCSHHGWMLIRLRFVPVDDGKCIMGIQKSRAAASNRAYVHTKRIQVQNKQEEYLKTHDQLPDPNEILQNAERSSMPFEE